MSLYKSYSSASAGPWSCRTINSILWVVLVALMSGVIVLTTEIHRVSFLLRASFLRTLFAFGSAQEPFKAKIFVDLSGVSILVQRAIWNSWTMLSNAFAGIAQAFSGERVNDNGNETPHNQFVRSLLMPYTIKIQKELRGRRFRVGRLCISLIPSVTMKWEFPSLIHFFLAVHPLYFYRKFKLNCKKQSLESILLQQKNGHR